jgi:hypothetical protein
MFPETERAVWVRFATAALHAVCRTELGNTTGMPALEVAANAAELIADAMLERYRKKIDHLGALERCAAKLDAAETKSGYMIELLHRMGGAIKTIVEREREPSSFAGSGPRVATLTHNEWMDLENIYCRSLKYGLCTSRGGARLEFVLPGEAPPDAEPEPLILEVDPERITGPKADRESGIYVRARLVGKWGNHDLLHLNRASVLAWLRSRASLNFAHNTVLILLGHESVSGADDPAIDGSRGVGP